REPPSRSSRESPAMARRIARHWYSTSDSARSLASLARFRATAAARHPGQLKETWKGVSVSQDQHLQVPARLSRRRSLPSSSAARRMSPNASAAGAAMSGLFEVSDIVCLSLECCGLFVAGCPCQLAVELLVFARESLLVDLVPTVVQPRPDVVIGQAERNPELPMGALRFPALTELVADHRAGAGRRRLRCLPPLC